MLITAGTIAVSCGEGGATLYGPTAGNGGLTGALAGASGSPATAGQLHSGGMANAAGSGGQMTVAGAAAGGSAGVPQGGTSGSGLGAAGSTQGGSAGTGGAQPAGNGGAQSGGSAGSSGASGASGGAMAGSGGRSMGGAGNTGNVQPPPMITNGSNGWASRYWDCCKPACGWQGNVRSGTPMTSCNQQNQEMSGNYDARNACESGGSAYMCWDGVPWEVGPQLSYGYAAASGPNYTCGRCFHLQFTGSGHNGNNPGVQGLNGKHMIVQVINNGGVEQDQFDLLIPGGGVGLLNACTTQWGTNDLGAQYGGFLRACNGDKNCTRQHCQRVFSGKPELMAGCEWFLGWFNAADNPNVVFKQIPCPQEIVQRSGLQDPG